MSTPTLPLDSVSVTAKEDPSPVGRVEDVGLAFAENEVLRGVSFRLARAKPKPCLGLRAPEKV